MIGSAVLRGVMLLKYLGGGAGKCHGLTMEGPLVPSEAREARSAGAPRGVGPSMGVWGLCPQKIFRKINVEIAHFQAFLQATNKMVTWFICSVGKARKIRHSIVT